MPKLIEPNGILAPETKPTVAAAPLPEPKAPPPSSTLAPTETFTSEHFSLLNVNENFRYAPNSRRIAHALIARNPEKERIALQFALPESAKTGTPRVCELSRIEAIQRFGMQRYRAIGPDGKKWYAKRFDHAKVKLSGEEDALSVDLAYFSEEEAPGKEPFWGSEKRIPRFKAHLAEEVAKDFAAESAEIKKIVKGGHMLHIEPTSVRFRDAHTNRKPTQNALMGESARDAYENFFGELEDELSPEMIKILKRAFNADIRKSPENQYRPEWLHAYGFSLTPAKDNPQKAENLGAAGKWANTEMLVLERIAKWFALNRESNTHITIKSLFEMLHDSELVDHIHFEVNIERKERFVRFIQELDAFKKFPIFRKASDLAQATGVTHAILYHEKPIKEELVLDEGKTMTKPLSTSLLAPQKMMPTAGAPILSSNPLTIQASLGESREAVIKKKAAPQVLLEAAQSVSHLTGVAVMPKSKFPTYIKHENSIVQVIVASHEPDYEEPWNGTHIQNSTGTGMVIEHDGEKYVLTNAHCVCNQIRTQIRLANNRQKKFDATPVCISYQADLALLKIKGHKFQEMAEPISLGEMVGLHDEVFTIGFPMGGDEVSVTKGIVSRIEVQDYSMSGLEMLQVQVDAAINPGNSGGPVFSGGKVVGVAFQGYSSGQSLGYMIPTPIVNHFLTEVFSGRPYRGFPILPIHFESLENKWQRAFYGMEKKQTGVLISKTGLLSDAHKKLKKDDILLEIDGYAISNQGTVDIPGIGNCIDLIHVTHMKFIGDTIPLKVLRKNDKTHIAEVHDIMVTLDHVPLETEVVPQTEYDKMPTYYINSGLVFVPVSRNYLEGPGSALEDLTIIDPELGSFKVGELPKKHPDHQLVAINTVLNCKSTEGYEGFTHQLVKKVNGKTIRNLQELISAMESHEEAMHLIETSDGSTIALKRLSASRLSKVMGTHKIAFDRSEDLRALSALDEEAGVAAQAALKLGHVHEEEGDFSEVLGSEEELEDEEDESDGLSASGELEDDEESESEEEVVVKPRRLLKLAAAGGAGEPHAKSHALVGEDGLMPGQRRFLSRLSALEHRYKSAPVREEVIDWDRLTEDEEEPAPLSGKKRKPERGDADGQEPPAKRKPKAALSTTPQAAFEGLHRGPSLFAKSGGCHHSSALLGLAEQKYTVKKKERLASDESALLSQFARK